MSENTKIVIDVDSSGDGFNEIRIPNVLRVIFTGWKEVDTIEKTYIVLYFNGVCVATLAPEYNEQFLLAVGDL